MPSISLLRRGHVGRFILGTFRTPSAPAVEARELADDQSSLQIDRCLDLSSPLTVLAPDGVFLIHTSKVPRIALVPLLELGELWSKKASLKSGIPLTHYQRRADRAR
jgi:hypothetical protein